MQPASAIIRFEKVSKKYRQDLGKKKSDALADLSFSVERSEVFGIIGPNGAGKSTTLKILMGFIRQDSGSALLGEHLPASPDAHRVVGYLPENPSLYENLTVTDHLFFAGRLCQMPKGLIRKRTDELLAMLELSHAANLPIRNFSKGMTQRAALAYALFNEPEILILDEPMSGLDPMGRQLVVDLIKDYNRRGNTILFCSHILTDVERICDRIAIMNKGRLVSLISPAELQKLHDQSDECRQDGASPLESFFLTTIKENSHASA
jgi:ABC-2 type transport system ATP-binding protein